MIKLLNYISRLDNGFGRKLKMIQEAQNFSIIKINKAVVPGQRLGLSGVLGAPSIAEKVNRLSLPCLPNPLRAASLTPEEAKRIFSIK